MAIEVDKLSEKVKELTAQNEELESTIMYHLRAIEETHSESSALHAILKVLKSNYGAPVCELQPEISAVLLSFGCLELAGVFSRREMKSEKPRRNSEQLDLLVNLILNGHSP